MNIPRHNGRMIIPEARLTKQRFIFSFLIRGNDRDAWVLREPSSQIPQPPLLAGRWWRQCTAFGENLHILKPPSELRRLLHLVLFTGFVVGQHRVVKGQSIYEF